MAEDLGLDAEERDEIRRAAELHDVGKMAIPDAILTKPGPLDPAEWEFIRNHTLIGERIIGAAPALVPVARLVRSSHERWDGSGYPDGLAGEAIPLGSRIIAVCDAFDAMTSERPYSVAMVQARALEEIESGGRRQFDPRVAAALRRVVECHSGADGGHHLRAASSGRVLTLCKTEGWTTFAANRDRAARAMGAPGVTALVAVEGASGEGRVLGFSQAVGDRAVTGYLCMLLVAGDARGRGIGKALTERTLRRLGRPAARRPLQRGRDVALRTLPAQHYAGLSPLSGRGARARALNRARSRSAAKRSASWKSMPWAAPRIWRAPSRGCGRAGGGR